jgi:translocation and assembly module TamB
LDVDLRRAGYAGGSLQGDIAIDTRGEGRGVPVDLDLDFAKLSLRPLIADQFPGEDLPIVSGLSGLATGKLLYRFDSAAPLAGSGSAAIRVSGASDRGLPLAGDIPLTLRKGVITSEDIRLTAPSQDVVVSGFRYDLQGNDGRLEFRLASRDVGRLAPLLAGEPVPGEEPPFWLPTEGRGTAEGAVTFAGKNVSVRVGLDLQEAVAPALTADTVRGSFTFSPTAVDELRLEMTRGVGALLLTGRVPLPEEGKTVAAEPLALAIDASEWPVPSLRYFLADLLPADLAGEIEGEVSGRLDLEGFPEQLTGRVEAEVKDLVVSGNLVGLARADLGFNQGSIVVERASVETPAGILAARGSFDQATEALDFTLEPASLSLAAEPLRQLLPDLNGTMEVTARIAGTLQQPDAALSVRGRDLVFRGRPLGEGGETAVQATWRGDRVEVGGSLLGLISFEGGGRLDRDGADVLVNLRSERLGALAALAVPQPLPDVTGALAGTLGLTADFSAQTSRALLQLSELSLQYQGRTISNLEPVVVALTGDRVEIRSFYLGNAQTKSEVFASGTLGLGEQQPLNLRVQASLSAAWAELALPGVDVDGTLDLLATVRGTLASPVLNGQGDFTGGQVIVPDFPQAFENITGVISFNRDRIVLERLQARLGSGSLQASGTLTLPGPGRGLSYRVGITGQDVSVRYPEGFLNRGNADLVVASTESGRQISGQIDLERTLYVEDIQVNTLELLQSLLQRQRLEVEETDDLLATTQLNLFVRGPDALRIRNNLANIQGDIDLTVRGTLARPVVFGEVEAEEGGEIVFNDTEYEIERGTVTFNNPYRIEPVLDLVARTEVRNFEITLNLEGPLDNLKTNFSSNANLADLEILSLLATGRPLDDRTAAATGTTAAQEVAPGQLAQQFLYGQAASALSQRVGTLFGFDRFRIDPLASTGQAISGVGVTIGKRLSRDVFVTYSTDPTSERQYIVQVEWQIRADVTLVLTQAGDGTYAVDAQWERRF